MKSNQKNKNLFVWAWSKRWKLLHYTIIINFVVEMIYAQYQIFFKLVPLGGSPGPLFGASQTITFELMVTRRLYAVEFWLATVGFALYVAILYGHKLLATHIDLGSKFQVAKSPKENTEDINENN